MKVVHINTYNRGGASIAAIRLHRELRQQGVESTFFNRVQAPTDEEHLAVYSHRITLADRLDFVLHGKKIHASEGLKKAQKPEFDWFSSPLSFLRPEHDSLLQEADVLHLHWVADFLNWPTFFKQFRHKPIVWTMHDQNAVTGGCHYAGACTQYKTSCQKCPQLSNDINVESLFLIKKKMLAQVERLQVVTPSLWLGGVARESFVMNGRNIKQIQYGIPTKVYTYSSTNLRKTLNIETEEKVILFVSDGITNTRKGFTRLLQALKTLHKWGHTYTCLLIGEGQANELPETGHRVLHLGSLYTDEALADAYRTADVFVTASLQDNYPNTIIEALCCGTPVVGYDSTGIAEMITPNFGVKANPTEEDSLANALEKGLSQVWDKKSISEKAHSLWSADIQARNYIALYNKLLEKRP